MKRLGIYVDFDNLYGACLDFLEISIDSHRTKDRTEIKTIIESFLEIFFIELTEYFSNYYISFIKVFAEFENLPHSRLVNIQQVLSSVGVRIITPFYVKVGKRKTKNASDIQLALEVATDFSIKKIDIDSIAIVSGDIDMYPLVSWFREHIGKEVFLMSLSKRLNSIYKKLDRFIYVFLLDDIFRKAQRVVQERLKTEEIRQVEQLEDCERFKMETINGLKKWFAKGKGEYVTTKLIIENWLPRWNINIDKLRANECLKYLVNDKERLMHEGIVFHLEREREGIIIGKFFPLSSQHSEGHPTQE